MKTTEINGVIVEQSGTKLVTYDEEHGRRVTTYETEAEAEQAYDQKVAKLTRRAEADAARAQEIKRRNATTFATRETAERVIVSEWGYDKSMIGEYECEECGKKFWAIAGGHYFGAQRPACRDCGDPTMVVEVLRLKDGKVIKC